MSDETGDLPASTEDRPLAGIGLVDDGGCRRPAILGQEPERLGQLVRPGADDDRDRAVNLSVLPHQAHGVSRVRKRCQRPVGARRVGRFQPPRPGIVAEARDEQSNWRPTPRGGSTQPESRSQSRQPARDRSDLIRARHEDLSLPTALWFHGPGLGGSNEQGSQTVKWLPFPGVDSTRILPPCDSTML